MFYQKNIQMGFYDGYVEKRTRKNTFFKQINMLIDWNEVEKEIKKVYAHAPASLPATKEDGIHAHLLADEPTSPTLRCNIIWAV